MKFSSRSSIVPKLEEPVSRGPGGLLAANPLEGGEWPQDRTRSKFTVNGELVNMRHNLTRRSEAQWMRLRAAGLKEGRDWRKAMREAEMALWNSYPPRETEDSGVEENWLSAVGLRFARIRAYLGRLLKGCKDKNETNGAPT